MKSTESHIRKGQWKEVKGLIQKKWGQLTNDDLEKTKGDLKMLVGLVQEKYGIAKKEAKERLSYIINKWSGEEHASEIYKNKTKQIKKETNAKIENLKKKVKNEIF